MIKVYLIDDLKTEINDLKSYFDNSFNKKEFTCIYDNFKKCSGSSAIPYTFNVQKEKLKSTLCDHWEECDFFLIDMLLIEKNIDSETKVSIAAIEEFLKENPNKLEQIKRNQKFIIVITGHWAENLKPADNGNHLLEDVLYVCKPLKQNEPQPIEVAYCNNYNNCNKQGITTDKLCDFNNCLKNILITLYERKNNTYDS